jgi:hypothetical protein
MYRINQNHEIVSLLLKLKDTEEEYPADLLSARRSSFMMLIARYVGAWIRIDRLLVK